MVKTEELNGSYGGSQTPCTVLCYIDGEITWYCVQGSEMVNATYEILIENVYVEAIIDIDCFTWNESIDTLEALESAVDDTNSGKMLNSAIEDTYCNTIYDTEAMQTDNDNNNFDPDDAESYTHESIVKASITNGQHKQAQEQADKFGLELSAVYLELKTELKG